MPKPEYIPPPYWPEGQRGESIEPKVMYQARRKLVGEVLIATRKDVERIPEDFTEPVQVRNNKKNAIWFTFKSKGEFGLVWWCNLMGVSHLKFRRRINEILEGQE